LSLPPMLLRLISARQTCRRRVSPAQRALKRNVPSRSAALGIRIMKKIFSDVWKSFYRIHLRSLSLSQPSPL
jgi:hypothetical protein